MKTFSGIINVLKFVMKYATVIAVLVKIIAFAIEQFETLETEKDLK